MGGRGSQSGTPQLTPMQDVPQPLLPTQPRRPREWLGTERAEAEAQHHLTIGAHPGADWMRRLALDGPGRKTSEPAEARRSTDCLASVGKVQYFLLRTMSSHKPSLAEFIDNVVYYTASPRNLQLHLTLTY